LPRSSFSSCAPRRARWPRLQVVVGNPGLQHFVSKINAPNLMCAEAIGEARRREPKDERVPEALYQCISAVHLDARTLGSTSTQSRPFPCFIAAMRIAHGLWRIASGTGAAIACRTEPTANGPPGVVTRRAKSAGETLDGDHGNRGWIALPNSGREREFTAFSGPTCARRSPAHARFSSHSPKTRESERLRCGASGIRTDMYGPSPVRKVAASDCFDPVAVMYSAFCWSAALHSGP
jgi:hypothetical protein